MPFIVIEYASQQGRSFRPTFWGHPAFVQAFSPAQGSRLPPKLATPQDGLLAQRTLNQRQQLVRTIGCPIDLRHERSVAADYRRSDGMRDRAFFGPVH